MTSDSRLSGFFVFLLSSVILLSSTILVFFKPTTFQKPYSPWSEFSNEDFSFQYLSGWIIGEKIVNGCSNTQTLTIPQNSSQITIINKCNYNNKTGKPFSSLEQFLGIDYTFYHYTKVNGVEIGTKYSNNNPGLYSPEVIAFLSPHSSSFFIIEFSPVHTKNPVFDHVLTSLQFKNIPSPTPAPGIDPSTGLRNLELNHLSFSLQPDWWYKSGVNYYQLNPTTWPDKDNVLPALGIVTETKNNADINTEKQYLIDTYKLHQTSIRQITVSGFPGLIISGTVVAPTGVNCPSCWTSPFSPDEKTKMAVIIYNDEVYRVMGNTGIYELEFDRLLTTFKFPEKIAPTVIPPPLRNTGCRVGGCSSELCLDAGSPDVASICIYQTDYACYKYSVCEKQPGGKCGWTKNSEFTSCLNSLSKP